MKKLMLTFLLASACSFAFGQTTATNFTANDCNGSVHDLFSDMDAGKVVVLVWVMPCGSCTGPAKTAFNIASSYSSSHPGVVKYYLIDDYGNSSCSSVSSWGMSNSIYADAVFSNSSISMSNYGTDGMPKIVIAGGQDHKIFFNQNNTDAGNSSALQAAMNQALSVATAIKATTIRQEQFSLYPNPASDAVTLKYYNPSTADVNIELFNMTGARVLSLTHPRQPKGYFSFDISISELPKGIYYLSMNGTFQKLSIQ